MSEKSVGTIVGTLSVLVVDFFFVGIIIDVFDRYPTYTEIYDILRNRKTVSYRIRHGFIMVITSMNLARLFYIYLNPKLLTIRVENPMDFFLYVLTFLESYRESYIFIYLFAFMVIFILIAETFFYYTPVDNLSWWMYEDAVINSHEAYQEAKLSFTERAAVIERKFVEKIRTSRDLNRFFAKKLSTLEAWYNLEIVDRNLLSNKPFLTMSFVEFDARKEGILALEFVESIRYWSLQTLFFFMFFISVWTLLSMQNSPSFRIESLVLTCDGIVCFLTIHLTLICGFRVVTSQILATVYYRFKLVDANDRLLKAIKRERLEPSGNNVILRNVFVKDIEYFLANHCSACVVAMTVNKHHWTTMSWLVFTLNFTTNAYLASALVLQKMPFQKFFLTVLVTIIQFYMAMTSMSMPCHSNRLFHKSKRILNSTQIRLKGYSQLRTKIKVNEVYERLNGKKKYGMSNGPNTIITYAYLFRMAIGYSIYMIAFLKMFRRSADMKYL